MIDETTKFQIWKRDGMLARLYPELAEENMKGYIYFAQSGPFVKVGMAKDAERRIKEISKQCLHPVQLLTAVFVDDARDVEAQLHSELSPYHYRGEWFFGCRAVMECAKDAPKRLSKK